MTYLKESPESIEEMFSNIAQNYDRANAALSLNLSPLWNNKLISELLKRQRVSTLLDLCAGTGAIAHTFLKKNPSASALLVDLSAPMLAQAKEKLIPFKADFIVGDACTTQLKNQVADAITVAYGVRNIANTSKFFDECFRLLKAEGTLAILELTRPENPVLRFFHQHYLEKLVPLIGRRIAGNGPAYQYLCDSIKDFSSPKKLSLQLNSAGFGKVEILPLFGGVATILLAQRKKH